MRAFLIALSVVVILAGLFVACKKKETPVEETAVTAETGETAAPVAAGDVAKGLELFKDVGLGTNGKSCESCHPEGGTKGMEGEMATKPLTGVKDRYPGVFMMHDPKKEVTLAEVVNFCITMPLKGEALTEDSPEMLNLLAYLGSL